MVPSIKLRFTAAGCIALALMLLVLPLRWILAWMAAAAIHEGCHALAVKLCGGHVGEVNIDCTGANMHVSGIARGRELICALAGPVGSLVLVFFAKWIPATAVCAVFQSAYNLLPLYPMDGGRALRCFLEMVVPQFAEKACRAVGYLTMGLICMAALYAAIGLELGLMPLLMALILWMKTGNHEKSLAIRDVSGYNIG